MNILIRFEDTFGCHELFNVVANNKGIYADSNITFKIEPGKSNTEVFHISKSQIKRYDYVILIFDMDDNVNISLTGEGLIKQLKFNILSLDTSNKIKPEYEDKVILIPVFFCFETLYLYSDMLVNFISKLSNSDTSRHSELLKLYSSMYDYRVLNPESIYNAKENLVKIQKQGRLSTTGNYLPQNFHLSYAKQLLRIWLADILYNENIKNNNKKVYDYLEKKENMLFELLEKYDKKLELIESIMESFEEYAIHNDRFLKLLKLKDIEDLRKMVLTQQSLNDLCNEFDTYNKSILGIQKDVSDNLDKLVIAARLLNQKINSN